MGKRYKISTNFHPEFVTVYTKGALKKRVNGLINSQIDKVGDELGIRIVVSAGLK